MADQYKQVKIGKLRLKGSSNAKLKSKKSRKRKHDANKDVQIITEEEKKDIEQHGGWWKIDTFDKLFPCNVAIETYSHCYVRALDNGTFSIGNPISVSNTSAPTPEETFTLVKFDEKKVAFKSGYDKFMSVNARGEVLGRSDAVGQQEQIEVVIDNGQLALQGHNGYFISITDDDELKAQSKAAKDKEMFILRTNTVRIIKKSKDEEEDDINVRQHEINKVKMFQSFQDRRLKITSDDVSKLENSRSTGKFNETMLDRREKMKSDRYCK